MQKKSRAKYNEKKKSFKNKEHKGKNKSRPSQPARGSVDINPALLYGTHACEAAILNPQRSIHQILATENGAENIAPILAKAVKSGLKRPEVEIMQRHDLEQKLPAGAVHQGIIVNAAPLSETSLETFCQEIVAKDKCRIMILDQVTDPHNIGAILRSSCVFGADAIIVQDRHSPEITGTLAKTACGAVEHTPMIRVTNLARAMDQLKKHHFWCLGLDERGEQTMAELELPDRCALVMGAEGPGLRRLTSEKCDILTRLPVFGEVPCLNVSNAAAVALYEMARC